jgi:hypothetical protein
MPRADIRNAFKPRANKARAAAVARAKRRLPAPREEPAAPAGAPRPQPDAADEEDEEMPALVHPDAVDADEEGVHGNTVDINGTPVREYPFNGTPVAAGEPELAAGEPDDSYPRPVHVREDLIMEARRGEAAISQAAAWRSYQLERARRLWACDYTPHVVQESLEHPELRAQVLEVFEKQTSSWRSRLKDEDAIRRYEDKTERMIRDTVAIARRRRNQLDIPFSVFARSISYFNQRVPTRIWREQLKSMRIVSRNTVMNMLNFMMEVEPKPPFITNPHVAVFGFDQCNHWQAAATSKKGEFRGAERLNSQGMPISIRSETVLNTVQRHIPFTNPLLSAAEAQLIRQEGRALATPFEHHPHLRLAEGRYFESLVRQPTRRTGGSCCAR